MKKTYWPIVFSEIEQCLMSFIYLKFIQPHYEFWLKSIVLFIISSKIDTFEWKRYHLDTKFWKKYPLDTKYLTSTKIVHRCVSIGHARLSHTFARPCQTFQDLAWPWYILPYLARPLSDTCLYLTLDSGLWALGFRLWALGSYNHITANRITSCHRPCIAR